MSKNSAKALYEQIKIFNNYIQYASKKKKKRINNHNND